MKNFKFELGLEVKEVITGYEGVIMGRSQFLTGCNQYGILAKKLESGKPAGWVWFDESRLKLTGLKIVLPVDDPGFDGNHPTKH